jgi:SAM-dependent methyltransferase
VSEVCKSGSVLRTLRAEVESFLSSFVGEPFEYYHNGGNAGDAIIALGALHCFERLGLSYRAIGPWSPTSTGTVVFAGGGNLIGLYTFIHDGLVKHLETASRIVVLPHTVRGNIELLRKLDSRTTIFCRDVVSYLHCKAHTSGAAHVFLGHDMAFHADLDQLMNDPGIEDLYRPLFEQKLAQFPRYLMRIAKREVVHFLRADAERIDRGLKSDMDVSEVFMGETSNRKSAEQSAWCFLSAIGRCEGGVVTDRLHVAVAASLLGIPCKLLDNNYGKNFSVYQLSMAGRFPHVIFEAAGPNSHDQIAAQRPNLAISYCVTGQPHLLERLEASIMDQRRLENEAGVQCPYARVLVTDLPHSKLSTSILSFFNHFVCSVDAFNFDPYVGKTYFSLAKARNAALRHAALNGFDWILLCDADTVIADYRWDPPDGGYGVPETYWQTSDAEDILFSWAKVQSPTERTFSQGNSWFLISASLFRNIAFNENIYGYGFEDLEYDARATAAGARLAKTALRVIHRFHAESQRAIDNYSHVRNRAIFEYVLRSVRAGEDVDVGQETVALPARHDYWQGALILFPQTGRVVQWDKFEEGTFEWISGVLRIAWDKFAGESFKNDRGTFVSYEPVREPVEPNVSGTDRQRLRSGKETAMASRSDVALAYQLILGRPAENEAVLDRFANLSLAQLGEAFIRSREFQEKEGRVAAKTHFFPSVTECGPISIETSLPDDIMDAVYEHVETVWSMLGKVEPHYSVLTNDKFKTANFVANSAEFYRSGSLGALTLRKAAARHGIKLSQLTDCLELGCGVGRVTLHLSTLFSRVIAVDISIAHLDLCRLKLEEEKVENVELRHMETIRSLDTLPEVDAFYSVIVLQHNPPPIMAAILRKVLSKLRPGGIAYFQIPTYAKNYHFSAQGYLSYINTGSHHMEMHVLPQSEVFRLTDQMGCYTLEVREDGAVGGIDWLSNTFFLRKR